MGMLLAVGVVMSGIMTPLPPRMFFEKPLVLGAHRGGAACWPENTLEAFRQASARWPDILLESDAHLTADGHLVLLHDGDVERTTQGKGRVRDLTLAQIKELDAGYRFTCDGGATYPYRGKGLTIPTFEEVLTALPQVRFLIEMKPQGDTVGAMVALLRKANALDRVALASLNPLAMAALQRLEPRAIRCYDLLSGMTLLGRLRGPDWASYEPAAEVLAIDEDMIKGFHIQPEELRAVRDKGIVVLVHTVNHADAMRRYIDIGLDSILTDHPDILAGVLATP